MTIHIDEVVALGSGLFVIYAITEMVGRYGGFRASLRSLVTSLHQRDMQGWQLILLGLLIPQLMQVGYYILLVLPLPMFEGDMKLRQDIVRSYTIFSNLILGIYFLNGKLISFAMRCLELWNSIFPTRLV